MHPGSSGPNGSGGSREEHATRRREWIWDREALPTLLAALLVGTAGGLAAVALRLLRASFHGLLFVNVGGMLSSLGTTYFALLPAIGGLIVGLMLVLLAQEARGAGVADVVLAVHAAGSRMRARVAAVKVVATSLAIGSGASAGIEGPIIQIGSALGSAVGQWRRLREEDLRVTLAAGAAAGIAATFDTPLAGVFFALEVILVDFSARSFGLVVLAAVTANVLSRTILGPALVIAVPPHALVHPIELAFYVLLGLMAAVVGVVFTLTLDRIEAASGAWAAPNWLKPAVGGLVVGLIGLFYPQVLGLGYETIESALANQLPLALLAALVIAKLIATSVTVGSGSSGGVIGPSLFIGGMLGGAAGSIFHLFLPQYTATSGAYALVGMAAVFAATAQAPITAIFTIFELSNDYNVMLPLMVACVTSSYAAHRITPHTIYSAGLFRRGIDVRTGRISLPPAPRTMYLDLEVRPLSRAVGRAVKELELPLGSVLITIRRSEGTVIPRGDTVIRRGDRITVACTPEDSMAVRNVLQGVK